jgi:hypothetical protein
VVARRTAVPAPRDQRDIALEIADLAQEPIPQTWRLPEPLPDDDEELAAMARRNLIEVAPVRFPAGGDEFAYLGFWIAALEEAGVLVITSAGVKVNEMRGFSLHFDKLPVIVVNGSDFARGRLFSLLHEYAHLILHTDGVCDMAPGRPTSADLRLEVRCNAIAAAILMPRAPPGIVSHRRRYLEPGRNCWRQRGGIPSSAAHPWSHDGGLLPAETAGVAADLHRGPRAQEGRG